MREQTRQRSSLRARSVVRFSLAKSCGNVRRRFASILLRYSLVIFAAPACSSVPADAASDVSRDTPIRLSEAPGVSAQVVTDRDGNATIVWMDEHDAAQLWWSHYDASIDSWQPPQRIARQAGDSFTLQDPYQTGRPVLARDRDIIESVSPGPDRITARESWVVQFDSDALRWSEWHKVPQEFGWFPRPVVVAPNGDAFAVGHRDDSLLVQRRDAVTGRWDEPMVAGASGMSSRVTLRASPRGDVFLLWSQRVSEDGGWRQTAVRWDAKDGQWQAPQVLQEESDAVFEQLEVDAGGDAFVSWTRPLGDDSIQIQAIRYNAELGSWEAPVTLFEPLQDGFGWGESTLAVGGGGYATVRYDFVGDSERAHISTYDPTTGKWTASRAERIGYAFEAPKADAAGNVFVLHPESNLTVNSGRFVVDRMDAATGVWSDTGLSFESGPSRLLVAQDGRAMVKWHIYDGERTFGYAATYSPATESWTHRELPVADTFGHTERYDGAFGGGTLFVWEQEVDSEPAIWAQWVE